MSLQFSTPNIKCPSLRRHLSFCQCASISLLCTMLPTKLWPWTIRLYVNQFFNIFYSPFPLLRNWYQKNATLSTTIEPFSCDNIAWRDVNYRISLRAPVGASRAGPKAKTSNTLECYYVQEHAEFDDVFYNNVLVVCTRIACQRTIRTIAIVTHTHMKHNKVHRSRITGFKRKADAHENIG